MGALAATWPAVGLSLLAGESVTALGDVRLPAGVTGLVLCLLAVFTALALALDDA